MRLLKASSITASDGLELISFSSSSLPRYAILSHTWGHDEVLYEDVVNRTSNKRAAFQKCHYACEQTLSDGLEYLWIDTCCIDKSSSAELSEAINSMFAWYYGSAICYAYVPDYMAEKGGCGAFSDSKWFTRGWTLQELLAPTRLIFYAAGWHEVGTKEDLGTDLAKFTSISSDILIGRRPMETSSIANRMGWAANRETTRPEDLAYCLMGIFSVNMPLLYGEGMAKAFFRLQEEIMKDSSDHTLFAWADPHADDFAECGMLAPSPTCFASTNMLIPYEESSNRAPHAWTNKGLFVELRLTPVHRSSIKDLFEATLNCPTPDFEEASFLTIYLKRTNSQLKRYTRVCTSRLGRIRDSEAAAAGDDSSMYPLRQIYVKETERRIRLERDLVYPYHYLAVKTNFKDTKEYHIGQFVAYPGGETVGLFPTSSVYVDRPILIRRGAGLITAAMVLVHRDGKKLTVTFGSTDPLRLAFDAQEFDEAGHSSVWGEKAQLPPPNVVKEAFNPRSLGEVIELRHHRVSVAMVNTEVDKLKGRSKTYRVKLCVEKLEAPPSWEEVISMDQKIQMGLEPQSGGRSSEKGKGKMRLKSLFGGPRTEG